MAQDEKDKKSDASLGNRDQASRHAAGPASPLSPERDQDMAGRTEVPADRGPHAKNWGPQEEYIESSPRTELAERELLSESDRSGYPGGGDDLGRRFLNAVNGVLPGDLSETIEVQLSRVPPAAFFGLALASMGVSLGLMLTREKKGWAGFAGLWAPTFLFLGVYSKMARHDEAHDQELERIAPTMH